MMVRCAAFPCDHDGDTWRFSPCVNGLVPACIAHELDIIAGGVRIRDDVEVIEQGVRA
jgi:hypothetical protein